MKKFLLLFVLFAACSSEVPSSEYRLTDYCVIVLADETQGKQLISQSDYYSDNLGEFDLRSKIRVSDSDETPTIQDYLNNAASNVKNWSNSEKKKLREAVEYTAGQILKLSLTLPLPDTVYVIRTTGKEEGGAGGYTRHNLIILTDYGMSSSTERVTSLFIHELFHVISRTDEIIREKIYSVLGFSKCNDINLPEDIFNRKISNPDAPYFDYYAELEKEDGTRFEGVMIIYSDREYTGGSFFEYLKTGFLKVEGETNEKSVVTENGGSVIVPFDNVTNFFDLVGSNTNYIINPEEVAADNFIYMIRERENLPSPEIINEFIKIFSN